MQPGVRKFVAICGSALVEWLRETPAPWRSIAAAAVPAIPWAGRIDANLKREVRTCGRVLGELLTGRMIALAGSGHAMDARGMAAVAGLDGETEHAPSLIHTMRFGRFFRQDAGKASYPSFTSTRGPANAAVKVPLMDESDARRRSHDPSAHFSTPDAPRADELVVTPGIAMPSQPHHRVGDRHQDRKDLGYDMDDPATV